MRTGLLMLAMASPAIASEASSSEATTAPTSALTAGPTSLFAMPGLGLRYERVVHERWSVPVEVHGESLGVAGRLGLRGGLDYLPRREGLRGPYLGMRAGTWVLLEQAGATVGVQAGPVVGYRVVSAKGLVAQAGVGVLPRHSLSGDKAWSQWLVPSLELRLGKALGGAQ